MRVDERRILLVEDDVTVGSTLCDILADEGYHISYCTSAAEVFVALRNMQPALAILDMRMEHEQAGLRLLQHIRDNRRTASIPTIIYSADAPLLGRLRDQIEGLGAAIVHKPFDLGELLALVESMIEAAPRQREA